MIRFLTAHSSLIATSAVLAVTVAGVGCSSEGSSFGSGGMGSVNNPTQTAGGNSSNPTQTGGGNSSNPTQTGGGNTSNPTQAMGGDTSNPTQATGGNTSQAGTDGAGGSVGGSGNQGPPCPKPEGEICHEFIANDNARHVINYIDEFGSSDKPGSVKWSTNLNDASTNPNTPRTLEIVDNAKSSNGKAILASIKEGFVELDLGTGARLGDVKLQNTTNISGACRMPDGNTALAADTKIRIVNATGAPVREFNIPTGGELRAINRHPTTGSFWLSRTEKVYEVNDQGQIQWEANMGAGTKGYSVWWREGGGAYATTGDPSTVVEIDANKTILNTVGDKKKFNFLDFFSGFVRTAEGHYIVANWLGHLTDVSADPPHVVEFTADNKLVWQWGNQTYARQITNVYVFR
jgi:hypothetical protein